MTAQRTCATCAHLTIKDYVYGACGHPEGPSGEVEPGDGCRLWKEKQEMEQTRMNDSAQKPILDACCGSRMFWFDRQHPRAIYMDNRQIDEILCDGRTLHVQPDIVADFRNIPFPGDSFSLVVFDPPHLRVAGEKSWMAKKYGMLSESWQDDLRAGFKECFRVLKREGVLIFKWNEEQVPLMDVLRLCEEKPLFGNRRAKTHWLVYMK